MKLLLRFKIYGMGHTRTTYVCDCAHENEEDYNDTKTVYNCELMAPMSIGSFPTNLKKRKK